jgi:2-keto-4-pentenoate hydratase
MRFVVEISLLRRSVKKRQSAPNPVRGTLFEKMLLKDGAEVPAKFGARPLFEADMMLEVKDAAINNATTPLEALRHISLIYLSSCRSVTGSIEDQWTKHRLHQRRR